MTDNRRDLLLFAGLGVLFAIIFVTQGTAYSLRVTVEALCYAMIAFGLSLQWGTAGLFNVGIMGFIAAGAFASLFVTFPVNQAFWDSEGPAMLGDVLVKVAIGAAAVFAVSCSGKIGLPKPLVTFLTLVTLAVAYLVVSASLDPTARYIEREAGFVGGLGLPVYFGWAAAGIVAGAIAWVVGKICLGLRSDYLAIATLGIAQIIKTFLKNADWLTRGTQTVSPLPWPVPGAAEVGFTAARASYLVLTAVMLVIVYMLLQRVYHAPWGRMMRAIRDNEDAASAMGKDVTKRRLEIFVFGCVLMGIGGATLIHFNTIFDPNGFVDLNHTFLIWVMVILGGPGNNRGAIFGALLVYVIWTMSEPVTLVIFDYIRTIGRDLFGWQAPADLNSRALAMRVFVIGLTITMVLRFAPKGVIPERLSRKA
ncbi:branched-chain amino acid ABC transporter permease [Georhizobium sp. MAB10]|uniref:branched-chain amino acid ABC transporter permease n=1 Tax=Georhizobium sp. MAB10 TaxID=3028319 RepID=UPI003855C56D